MIIDISANNTVTDLRAAAAAEVEHIIIRATLGAGTLDEKCAGYAADAQAAGPAISYYHVGYPGIKHGGTVAADAFAQAEYFLNTVQTLPPYQDLVLDIEVDTTLSRADFAAWVQMFIDHVYARTDKMCIIYSNAPYLDAHLPADHTFGQYRLWLANYNKVTSAPPLPAGFPNWFMWQYTETGTVPGITGNVDISKLNEAEA